MAMRLLPKSEVVKAKAAAQKRDIDEGVKIARRVDNLREVAAQEEESLEKFRREAVAKIHADIEKAQSELGTLQKEIRDTKRDREQDKRKREAEWQAIAKAQEALVKQGEEANAKTATADEAERGARRAVKQAADYLARAATKDGEAHNRLVEATRARKEAKAALANSEKVEAKTLKWAAAKEAELAHREQQVEGHERGLILREAKLDEGTAELANGWRLLNDRIALHERNIKRAKK